MGNIYNKILTVVCAWPLFFIFVFGISLQCVYTFIIKSKMNKATLKNYSEGMNDRWLLRWRNHIDLSPMMVFERVGVSGLEERGVKHSLDGMTIMRWGRKVLGDCREMEVEGLDWSREKEGMPLKFQSSKPLYFLFPLPGVFFHWWHHLQDPAGITLPLQCFLFDSGVGFCFHCAQSMPVLLHRMHLYCTDYFLTCLNQFLNSKLQEGLIFLEHSAVI